MASIAAAEEPGVRALCMWSPAAVAVDEVGSGHLQGRSIAAEFAAHGYFDSNGHRLSPALVEDLAELDVYGRAAAYTGPVRILHGDHDEVVPTSYVQRYLEHYPGNAELEIVEGADHSWATIPHRTRLHQSTLRFFRRHLAP